MSVLASTVPADTTQEGFRLSRMTPAEKLGLLMIVPYIILFLVFVVYPVGYGLWLARNPASYVKLANDPIFLRTVINTLIFLGVGITIKMIIALFLSDFFVQDRWWIRILGLIFILHWAIADDHRRHQSASLLNPGVGCHRSRDLRTDG